jgi:hypothetical protein
MALGALTQLAHRTSPRWIRAVLAALAVLAVLQGGLVYQLAVRNHRPPTFLRGGRFDQSAPVGPVAGAVGATPTTPAPAVAPTTATAGPDAGSATSKALPGAGRAGLGGPALAGSGTPTGTATVPRLGTYTWAVSGTEAATGFGSRSFPDQMTMVAHSDNGLGPSQVVLDITYSSDHTERELLDRIASGLAFDFEGGQVTFGGVSQNNQGDYRPPMVQVPNQLAPGQTVSGTSPVIASDGSTERTEDWTVHVVDQETIPAAGQPVPTWKVSIDRQSRPGSSQRISRSRTYWYDPVRALWVKYTEREHGEQPYGPFTFTYDDNLTATLSSFQPS